MGSPRPKERQSKNRWTGPAFRQTPAGACSRTTSGRPAWRREQQDDRSRGKRPTSNGIAPVPRVGRQVPPMRRGVLVGGRGVHLVARSLRAGGGDGDGPRALLLVVTAPRNRGGAAASRTLRGAVLEVCASELAPMVRRFLCVRLRILPAPSSTCAAGGASERCRLSLDMRGSERQDDVREGLRSRLRSGLRLGTEPSGPLVLARQGGNRGLRPLGGLNG
jgi:hypothetical protein